MGSFIVVKDGDHISKIAKKFRFRSFRSIWDDPGNAALRQIRTNPHVLLPGDSIFIRDKQDRDEPADTGKRHTFFTIAPSLKLRIVIKDCFDVPLGGEVGTLDVDGDATPVATTGEGLVERVIPIDAEGGQPDIVGATSILGIGRLHPVEHVSGWLARLNNVGYDAGEVGNPDAADVRSATEEFQCDFALPITGTMDATTQQRLMQIHGC